MAYIATEQVKLIREKLKKELPQYKLSVTKSHHSGVLVTYKKGPAPFEPNLQINHYWYETHYADKPLELATLKKTLDVIYSVRVPKYHETGDYGSQPDFYINIHTDRNYEVTSEMQ